MASVTRISMQNMITHKGTGPRGKSLCQVPATSPLAPVVQRANNAIRRMNDYPVDKCWKHKLHFPLDSDLSSG